MHVVRRSSVHVVKRSSVHVLCFSCFVQNSRYLQHIGVQKPWFPMILQPKYQQTIFFNHGFLSWCERISQPSTGCHKPETWPSAKGGPPYCRHMGPCYCLRLVLVSNRICAHSATSCVLVRHLVFLCEAAGFSHLLFGGWGGGWGGGCGDTIDFIGLGLQCPAWCLTPNSLGVDPPFFFNHRSFQKPAVSPGFLMVS